ncbi:T-cell surface glycoprotein CD8 alpha chain [Hoplias malabaricus]|uniref:T-cell surface glycoprotein CD8 alpha chain n=1 Tax=Hoplias malabaricus TaxID=27720 RepID=UPI0034626562
MSRKMSVFSTGLLVFLFLIHGGGSKEVKEGEDVEITCDIKTSGQNIWYFRVKHNMEIEFIMSVSDFGQKKGGVMDRKFETVKGKVYKLKNFQKEMDSGSYSCLFIKGNMMEFGHVVSLTGTPDPKPKIPTTVNPPRTTKAEIITTKSTEVCVHKNQANKVDSVFSKVNMGCELVILIPLAVGSSLLFILLIITIIYCNRIRTRRCPHHYKRQPRNKPAGHRPLPHQPEF